VAFSRFGVNVNSYASVFTFPGNLCASAPHTNPHRTPSNISPLLIFPPFDMPPAYASHPRITCLRGLGTLILLEWTSKIGLGKQISLSSSWLPGSSHRAP